MLGVVDSGLGVRIVYAVCGERVRVRDALGRVRGAVSGCGCGWFVAGVGAGGVA